MGLSPQIDPPGPTSNFHHCVTDAAENRTPVPLRNRGFQPLVNDSG